ncbi:MAG: amidohydrolase family protein [Rhodovarius sp.]|nr:amidohydrolase family protein [Rhodovarius sp.]
MTDLLISGGVVVTMDAARRVIPDGAVAVAGGRILAVGPRAEVEAAHPAPRQRIEARGRAVLPGLIDAHGHAGHGLIKTMGSGDSAAWFEACARIYTHASPPDFWKAEARLAALERLMFGITTGVSVLGGGDCVMRVDRPDHGAAHAEGVAEIGIRDIMAVGYTRPPFPRLYDGVPVDAAQQLASMRALFRDWHGRGRQMLCTMMPVWRGDATHREEIAAQGRDMLALAAEYGALFHQDGHRAGSIAAAHLQFGLLSPRAFLSHCTDLTEEDIAALVESGASVVHNPTAIAAVRGFCPVVRLLEAGVPVILGSDATAPDRSSDLFRHMMMARRYAQRAAADENLLPPGRVLEMCTVDAARALGLDDLGVLAPGMRADIITVDLSAPHMAPANMPVWRLVCFATGADVRDVVVEGEVLMRERIPHVDVGRVVAEAERQAEAMLARSGLAALAQEDPGWGRVRR